MRERQELSTEGRAMIDLLLTHRHFLIAEVGGWKTGSIGETGNRGSKSESISSAVAGSGGALNEDGPPPEDKRNSSRHVAPSLSREKAFIRLLCPASLVSIHGFPYRPFKFPCALASPWEGSFGNQTLS